MQLALDYGLNSELAIALSDQGGTAPKKPSSKPSTAPPAATTKTGTGTNASPDVPQPASPSANATANNSAIGRLCWDPNLARPDNRHDIITYMHNVCDYANTASPMFGFPFQHVNFTNVQFIFRSSYGVYKYLGQLLREHSAARIHFANLRGFEQRELISGPFLNIREGASPDCLVTAFYNGESFCVPRQGSNSTAVLLDILGELKTLSVSPTDLNAAFAVRLVN
jgi:hypothetical protein